MSCSLRLSDMHNHLMCAQHSSRDAFLTGVQELDVLRHAVSLPEDERAKPAPVQAPPPELMASLQQAAAALGLNQAEQMRAAVFRPSHVLPTVTLAEQVHTLRLSIFTSLPGALSVFSGTWQHPTTMGMN